MTFGVWFSLALPSGIFMSRRRISLSLYESPLGRFTVRECEVAVSAGQPSSSSFPCRLSLPLEKPPPSGVPYRISSPRNPGALPSSGFVPRRKVFFWRSRFDGFAPFFSQLGKMPIPSVFSIRREPFPRHLQSCQIFQIPSCPRPGRWRFHFLPKLCPFPISSLSPFSDDPLLLNLFPLTREAVLISFLTFLGPVRVTHRRGWTPFISRGGIMVERRF